MNTKYILAGVGLVFFYMWYRKNRTVPVAMITQTQYNEINGVKPTQGGAALPPPPAAAQVYDDAGYNTGFVSTGGPLLTGNQGGGGIFVNGVYIE